MAAVRLMNPGIAIVQMNKQRAGEMTAQSDLAIMDRFANALETLGNAQPAVATRTAFWAPDFDGKLRCKELHSTVSRSGSRQLLVIHCSTDSSNPANEEVYKAL